MDGASFSSGSSKTGNISSETCILVVNDDSKGHSMVAAMLQGCNHEVLHFEKAVDALEAIRGRKAICDLVLTFVHMPEMDELQILKRVEKEFKLPVILMSANEIEEIGLGLHCGVAIYFVKSLGVHNVQNFWQSELQRAKVKMVVSTSSINGVTWDHRDPTTEEPKEKSEQKEVDEDEFTPQKKPRVIWNDELHGKFLEAIEQLGLEKAFPQKILDIMNIPGLTRYNVASHLQKHRKKLVQEGKKSAYYKGKMKSTNGVYEPCSLVGHSPLNFSAQQGNPPFLKQRPVRTHLEPGFRGTTAMPSYGSASFLDPKILNGSHLANLGNGQSLSQSNQGNLQPLLETSRSFVNASELPCSSPTSSSYVEFKLTSTGDLVGHRQVFLLPSDESRRNMALSVDQRCDYGIANPYPLPSTNSIMQQQPFPSPPLPPSLDHQYSDSLESNEEVGFLRDIFLNGDFDNLKSGHSGQSLIQQQGAEAFINPEDIKISAYEAQRELDWSNTDFWIEFEGLYMSQS